MKHYFNLINKKNILSFLFGLICFLYFSIRFAETKYYQLGYDNPLNEKQCINYGKLDTNYCYTEKINNYPKGALYGLVLGTSLFVVLSIIKKRIKP
jgi:hypothetical protein